jgi:trk system potassium uptake protein TrkA
MKIIIIGCGRVGSGLAKTMTLQGHVVSVVDADAQTFERLGPTFTGQTIAGIGFDRDVLIKAGIERADAFAAVSQSDELNLVSARMASQIFHVPKVVARVYDPRKADIYQRLGLQTIAPVTWGVTRIAELLSFSPFGSHQSLGAGQVDLVDVDVPPLLVGRAVHHIAIPGEVQVVAVTRGGRTFLPSLGTVLQEGDMLHLAVLGVAMDRVKSLLALA